MTQRDDGHDYRDSKNRAMEYKRNKKLDALANKLLCVFSEYMDDYTLEEFFTDTDLTKEGQKLFNDIKKTLKE
tara:strand:- start:258 stop:476 length:219 start_codon:yes stop_codon:yes gene_type:complete